MNVGTFIIILIGFYLIMAIPIVIYENSKSPERKKEEQERFAKNRAELKRRWEQEKMNRQEIEIDRPAKGCLQNMLEYTIAAVFLFVVIIVCIMLIVSTQM